MSKTKLVFVFALVAMFSLFVAVGCELEAMPETPAATAPQEPAKVGTGLDPKEYNNLAFKDLFPAHWTSYMKNSDDTVMTKFAGSVPHQKHNAVDALPKGHAAQAQPYLKNLWLGMPFMYQYDRARGHVFAIDDVLHIDRIDRYSDTPNFGAACYACKSTTIPKYVEQYGDKFWSMNFNEFRGEHNGQMHSIGCSNCHDPVTMKLVITQPSLDEALKRQGKDWRTASHNDMRALVCAQCHVEYFFEKGVDGGTQLKPRFPWDKGMNPTDMWAYYESGRGAEDGFKGRFADFTHAASGVPSIKVQHPEYEMWKDGVHGAAGVTCADCHMPRVTVDGQKISSHQWTSPLKNDQMIKDSCLTCHAGKTTDFLKSRVEFHQEKTFKQLLIAQGENVRAHEAVRLARLVEGHDAALLAQAVTKTREAQLYWDYVSAENSVGFHNPTKAMETLILSERASRDAVELAKRATGNKINAQIEGDIKTIVPPIEKFSRELHMDAEYLKTNKWLSLLKPLEKKEMLWDGNKRLK
ncbi:cytochrome C nitrite reductase [Desulfuribacillus stibiiarsenatis]|uniref:nitrite reductase (cytochrome; ammonia-forming) n=1 Tax=Desulfuribacillus stibiiarsenatis TaxID=1390249 RepID=A0A1E5L9R4_9FIRM|nr:ammonia-forming cytochrome c nitrite reductase subunit c552 [Desulfuribacillus stibiiarsenatis]OEH86880.1 cytochrome C nitrite reductase [Desulfuribacillus stibiiarsenatis]